MGVYFQFEDENMCY